VHGPRVGEQTVDRPKCGASKKQAWARLWGVRSVEGRRKEAACVGVRYGGELTAMCVSSACSSATIIRVTPPSSTPPAPRESCSNCSRLAWYTVAITSRQPSASMARWTYLSWWCIR
jgi:hypothetical protein